MSTTFAGVVEPDVDRECAKCKVIKPLSDYHRDRSRLDGRSCWCKTCSITTASARYYRVKDRPEEKLKKRLYSQTPEQRAAIAVVQKRLKEKYPERFRARMMLNNAIKRGKMKRGDCQVCGVPNAHAHHHDYSKPFDVEWFCRACHADVHRAERGTPATGMRRTG